MIILSRKIGERVMIGDDISIVIKDIRSDRVRLGIDAPRSVSINREEIYKVIANQKRRMEETHDA